MDALKNNKVKLSHNKLTVIFTMILAILNHTVVNKVIMCFRRSLVKYMHKLS